MVKLENSTDLQTCKQNETRTGRTEQHYCIVESVVKHQLPEHFPV